MSFQYPMHMSRELLVSMASQFPVQIDLLGPGLVSSELVWYISDTS